MVTLWLYYVAHSCKSSVRVRLVTFHHAEDRSNRRATSTRLLLPTIDGSRYQPDVVRQVGEVGGFNATDAYVGTVPANH